MFFLNTHDENVFSFSSFDSLFFLGGVYCMEISF